MIHIGLAEQNRRIARVLKEKIELSPDFKVDLIIELNAEVFDSNMNEQWDLIIVDGGLLIPIGGQMIKGYSKKIMALAARFPLVLASSFVDLDQQISALVLGAKGVLHKSDQPEKIHQAIFQSIEGGMRLSQELRRSIVQKLEARKDQSNFSEDDLQLA